MRRARSKRGASASRRRRDSAALVHERPFKPMDTCVQVRPFVSDDAETSRNAFAELMKVHQDRLVETAPAGCTMRGVGVEHSLTLRLS